MKIYECSDCKTIHLHEKKPDKSCENCGGDHFEQLNGKYIIHCPMCLEYWPKHVIKLVSQEGLIECPGKTCTGMIELRYWEGKELKSDEDSQHPDNETLEVSDLKSELEVKEDIEKAEKSDDDEKNDHALSEEATEEVQETLDSKEEPQKISEHSEISDSSDDGNSPDDSLQEENKEELIEEFPDESDNVDSDGNIDESVGSLEETDSEQTKKEESQQKEKTQILPSEQDEAKKSSAKKTMVLAPQVMAIETVEIDLHLDLQSIKNTLNEEKINELFDTLLNNPTETISIYSEDNISLLEGLLHDLHENSQFYIEEPIQNIFYIGDLRGDLERAKIIIEFLVPLIDTYPSVKICILGNYFGKSDHDIITFLLLVAFYLKYPENVVLLKGALDFKESLDRLQFYNQLKNLAKDNSEKERVDYLYKLILNNLRKLLLFHIGSMNQGQIRIFSSNNSVPLDEGSSNLIISIDSVSKNTIKQDFAIIDIDKYSKSIFMKEISQGILYEFFKINSIHYFVKANKELENGVDFQFSDLCCSVYSTGKNPKIVQLAPGQSPIILSVDKEQLKKELLEKYGINQ